VFKVGAARAGCRVRRRRAADGDHVLAGFGERGNMAWLRCRCPAPVRVIASTFPEQRVDKMTVGGAIMFVFLIGPGGPGRA